MRTFSRLALASALALAPLAHASATPYIAGGIGWYNFTESDHKSSSSAINAEWRGDDFYYGFQPVIGAMVNTDGGAYGYVGLNYDWEFMPKWYLTPGIDIGGYAHGSGIDLGGPVEFREQIEADYKFDNQMRAGLQLSHMSNAGIYNHNPGEEAAMVMISLPFGPGN